MVTGDVDNNVHPGNTLRMADALLKAGKNFDLVVLPGIRHGFSGIQDDFFQRKMWFHFAKHLLGDYTSETYREISLIFPLPSYLSTMSDPDPDIEHEPDYLPDTPVHPT